MSRLYHYVITLQKAIPNGYSTNTIHGTWRVVPGDTRSGVYAAVLKSAKEAVGADEAVTVFFSLEPDDLGVGDAP